MRLLQPQVIQLVRPTRRTRVIQRIGTIGRPDEIICAFPHGRIISDITTYMSICDYHPYIRTLSLTSGAHPIHIVKYFYFILFGVSIEKSIFFLRRTSALLSRSCELLVDGRWLYRMCPGRCWYTLIYVYIVFFNLFQVLIYFNTLITGHVVFV